MLRLYNKNNIYIYIQYFLVQQDNKVKAYISCMLGPVDVQSQAVGLPAHRGRVGLQQEAAQELNQSFFVCKFVELTDQSTAQLILLTTHSLTCSEKNKVQEK